MSRFLVISPIVMIAVQSRTVGAVREGAQVWLEVFTDMFPVDVSTIEVAGLEPCGR